MTPDTAHDIAATIRQTENLEFTPSAYERVYGGDINQCYLLSDSHHRYFVKTNRAQHLPMLQAEINSLNILQAVNVLTVPRPVAVGASADCAYLVLEYYSMHRQGDAGKLAQGLAELHHQTSPDGRFGWHENNFIGTSPQYNRWHSRWGEFWLEERLQPQLNAAYRAGHEKILRPLAQQLEARLDDIWGDYQPAASLLHGDLWGGNAAYLDSGEPVIYDPVSYYGDRETDLALTELFGGFPPEFYQEYQRIWPLQRGYETRKQLYNLYHLLNHLNLFGEEYLAQCRSILAQLLAQP